MTTSRVLGTCLAIALGIEALLWTTGTASPLAAVLGWSKYAPLVLLGFLLGRQGHSYRTAFANTWAFALVWTVFFYFRVQHPDVPVSAEELAATRAAGLLPYGIFLLLSLILACAAAAVGVWLSGMLARRVPADADAP